MNAYSHLDIVTNYYVSNKCYSAPFNCLRSYVLDKTKDEELTRQILKYWRINGYASQDSDQNQTWSLTIDGLILIDQNGFQGEYARRISENIRLANLEKHQKTHRSYMTILTLVIAFFGLLSVIYYYLDLASRLHWYPFLCH